MGNQRRRDRTSCRERLERTSHGANADRRLPRRGGDSVMSTDPLPDFRDAAPLPEKILQFDDLVAAVGADRDDFNFDLLKRAYDFAEKHHEGQIRRSGDPYLHHCVSVAAVLAELNLDATTIAAGLLHDILEDTQVSYEELRSNFGEAIATIVNGVSKIGGIKFNSPEEHQAENWRKMLLSIAQD